MSNDLDQQEVQDLIDQLLTRAGFIMEDASILALVRSSCGGEQLARVRELAKAAGTLMSLTSAAEALLNG